ncbi:zinc finger protein 135 isoform X2 [Microcaecilia unicolor]|uniref:Zinc finger protein 135-like isoform X2 n=1 Tax=Microcaecilia unicolor TaxID=1415580 RepID=A0A6P7XLU9_9AMPH|nr:zinc finger protein 135-like isoform X2 [Microcaecilia unicolor]
MKEPGKCFLQPALWGWLGGTAAFTASPPPFQASVLRLGPNFSDWLFPWCSTMKKFPEKHKMPVHIPQKPMITFNAVAAYFSEAVWEALEEWQKELYRSVVQEIHGALLSLGYSIIHPDVLLRIKGQEEPYKEESGKIYKHHMTYSSDLTPDLLLCVKVEDETCMSDQLDPDRDDTVNLSKASGLQTPDPLLPLEQEEESCFGGRDGSNHPHTADHPIITSVFSLSGTEEESPYPRSWQQLEQKCGSDTPSTENGVKTSSTAKNFPADPAPPLGVASTVHSTSSGLGEGPKSSSQDEEKSWKTEQPLQSMYLGDAPSIWSEPGKTFDSCPGSSPQREQALGKVLCPDSQHLRSFRGNREFGIESGRRPFKLTVCEKNLHQNPELKDHLRVTTGDIPYRCAECGKVYNHRLDLKAHESTHAVEGFHRCTEYRKSFGQGVDFRVHERFHVVQKPYKCAHCGKAFSQGSDLKIHLGVHAEEKLYSCSECGKGFSQSLDLKVHEKIHAAERPYKCGLCEKSFGEMASLLQHKRNHAGDLQHLPPSLQQAKTYKFIEYRKAFVPRATHPKPLRAPMGDRPFPCTVCGKTFGKKHNLKVHERTHTGERPYGCIECGKRFIHKHHLIKHYRVHRA